MRDRIPACRCAHAGYACCIAGTHPELDGNEVTVESVELAYETVEVKAA